MLEIITQTLGFCALACGIISFHFNTGKKFFFLQMSANLFFSVHFLMLGGYSGFVLNSIGTINFILYYFKSLDKPFARGKHWLYMFWLAYIAVGAVFTIKTRNIIDFLPSLSMIFSAYASFSGDLRVVRFSQLLVISPFWFSYDVFIHSYSGCISEALGFVSALIAVIRYRDDLKMLKIRACAKINLVLSVNRKRDDGYHDLSTVMQTVNLCDLLHIRRSQVVTVRANGAPSGEDNICYKAAKLFSAYGGANIRIKKRIPLCAGLGGGSSDAAAVLLGLNRLYGEPFSREQLAEMALSLGSDVPFFLQGSTAKVEGKGDVVTPLSPLCCDVVIVKDAAKQSTGDMYKQLDEAGLCDRSDEVSAFAGKLKSGNLEELASSMFNDFEKVCDCDEIKNDLLSLGAKGAALSGSGPSVFGLFDDADSAQRCASELAKKYKNVFACHTAQSAIIFE